MDESEHEFQPLDDVVIGCKLAFVPVGDMYQPMAALAILAALNAKHFTGVCVCFIRPSVRDGVYLMGVGLKFEGDAPDDSWWGSFVDLVGAACEDDEEVRLDRGGCEFASVGELRATMRHAGTAGFEAGLASWVVNPVGPDPDSPFTLLCRRIPWQES